MCTGRSDQARSCSCTAGRDQEAAAVDEHEALVGLERAHVAERGHEGRAIGDLRQLAGQARPGGDPRFARDRPIGGRQARARPAGTPPLLKGVAWTPRARHDKRPDPPRAPQQRAPARPTLKPRWKASVASGLLGELLDESFAFASPRGNVTRWGAGAARLFGMPADEVAGRSLFDTVLAGGDDGGWRALLDGEADSARRVVTTELRRADGREIPCVVRFLAVPLAGRARVQLVLVGPERRPSPRARPRSCCRSGIPAWSSCSRPRTATATRSSSTGRWPASW